MIKKLYRTCKLSVFPLFSVILVITLRGQITPAENKTVYNLNAPNVSSINQSHSSDKLQFHYKDKFLDAAAKNGFVKFPSKLVNNVTRFVYFIGPIRSSHSIIGSFIDAHKNAIVADEFNLFHQLISTPTRFSQKSDVVSALWEGAWLASNGGNREENFKGYNLKIQNLWNGFYENSVQLVGDKIGFLTVEAYVRNPKKFKETLNKLKEWFTVKTIFVVRNPFDNVATLSLYDHIDNTLKVHERGTDHIRNFKNSNACQNNTEDLVDNPRVLQSAIRKYSKWINQTHKMIEDLEPDLKIVFIRDFIRYPHQQMYQLCQFLDLQCSPEFLEAVASKMFDRDSKSRYSIKWTRNLYRELDTLLDLYPQYFHSHSFFD